MIFEKNNLQTVQGKSKLNLRSRELIALYVHLKNSIAIMALDHSRLGLENKFLVDKFTLQNLANKSGDV